MANYVPRLKEKYLKEIRTGLKQKFSYKNDMMIPKLQKIVLNLLGIYLMNIILKCV